MDNKKLSQYFHQINDICDDIKDLIEDYRLVNDLTEKLRFLKITEDFSKCSLHITKDAKRRKQKRFL